MFLRPLDRTKLLILRIYLKFFDCPALSALYLQIKFKPRLNVRSQKFARGEGCFGSLGAETSKTIGGPGAKPRTAGRWRSGGKAYSSRRHGSLGAEPPTLKNFAFFCKNNFNFRAILIKNNAFKTWHRN